MPSLADAATKAVAGRESRASLRGKTIMSFDPGTSRESRPVRDLIEILAINRATGAKVRDCEEPL